MGDQVTAIIKSTSGENFEVSVALSDTVHSVKVAVEQASPSSIAANNQRLVYRGQVLKDENTLADYGFKDADALHVVRGAPSPGNRGINNSGSDENCRSRGQPSPAPAPAPAVTPADAPATRQPDTQAPAMDFATMQRQMLANPEMVQQAMSSVRAHHNSLTDLADSCCTSPLGSRRCRASCRIQT
eukprot:COSAG05_NODE_43_length_25931_cov_49.314636_1_plen_186_part_00